MKKILVLIVFFMITGALFAEEVDLEKAFMFPQKWEGKEITISKRTNYIRIGEVERAGENYYLNVYGYDGKLIRYPPSDPVDFLLSPEMAEKWLDYYDPLLSYFYELATEEYLTGKLRKDIYGWYFRITEIKIVRPSGTIDLIK